jgi:pimeloyl-ACP methyl ester carboxylesterase
VNRSARLGRNRLRLDIVAASLFLIAGCVGRMPMEAHFHEVASDSPQPDDLTLNVPHLSSCTDNPDHTLHLKLKQPVTVLVHGCFGSSGEFRGLAQVLAFHGQQTLCFSYDDRASLTASARQLREAIDLLVAQTRSSLITVMGHSQGALIAHKSLTDLNLPPPDNATKLRLVTISGPFGGIAAAKICGKRWLYPLTVGLLPLSCYIATGTKWADITNSSRFIRQPGMLIPEVSSFLKIDTDERGSCRRENATRCVDTDDVFSLAEQRNDAIETDTRARRIQVIAGHVEIVGDKSIAPMKLILFCNSKELFCRLRRTNDPPSVDFSRASTSTS